MPIYTMIISQNTSFIAHIQDNIMDKVNHKCSFLSFRIISVCVFSSVIYYSSPIKADINSYKFVLPIELI